MGESSSGKLYVGTSGWSYNHWRGRFYPENLPQTGWLSYYAQHFDTVEINSSFYHLPKPSVFENWTRKTPDNFIFVVKVSRYITHIKRLKDSLEPFKLLLEAAKKLGNKLGPFLFQFPPRMRKDTERLSSFLESLSVNFGASYKYAFEFRDESWFCDDIYDVLSNYECAIIISSSPYFPYHEVVTGNFCYIRMHGGTELYSSNYSENELRKFALMIKKNLGRGIDTYVYFNNDANAYAVYNAKTLVRLICSP